MDKNPKKISDEEKVFIDTLIGADIVYDGVLSQLNIPEDDELYRNLILGMLKRQTKDHLVFAIWNNLDEKQTLHLRDYINQISITHSWMSHEDVLMEFALMYPDLMEKVYKSLSEFFQRFIEKFNEISEA